MAKMQYVGIILLVFLILIYVFQKPIVNHIKIALFITEEFPQIPLKPLGLVSRPPQHRWVEFDSVNGKVVADLYLPRPILRPFDKLRAQDRPAVILTMGVKTEEKDKVLIRHFADTMARLGYVVLWPRLETLDRGESLPEEPPTFMEGFKYLQSLCHPELRNGVRGRLVSGSKNKIPKQVRNDDCMVDPNRISYVGFSVGSSTALVAASDSEIRDRVHALVFFGGQFDIFEYLLSLASKTYQTNGKRVEWNVADGARDHAKTLLEVKHATQAAQIFETDEVDKIENILSNLPAKEKEGLQKYNPQFYLAEFKGKLFILHDVSDTYVPYVESVRLSQALPSEQIGAFVITDLFEHVQPNRPLTWQNIQELFKVYGLLYKTFIFL